MIDGRGAGVWQIRGYVAQDGNDDLRNAGSMLSSRKRAGKRAAGAWSDRRSEVAIRWPISIAANACRGWIMSNFGSRSREGVQCVSHVCSSLAQVAGDLLVTAHKGILASTGWNRSNWG